MPRKKLWSIVLLALLLVAGCGEIPTPYPPAQPPTATPPGYSEIRPPTITPLPYPFVPPTPVPWSPSPTPVQPTPIVLGEEAAPLEQQETYISTTVVAAPVGDGPGEIGFRRSSHEGEWPISAYHFTVDGQGNVYVLDVVNRRVAQFDPQGHFVANIVYGKAVESAEGLAVDTKGRVYIYEAAVYGPSPEEAFPKIMLFDREGHLLQEFPIPSWLGHRQIRKMRVDEAGILWVEGDGPAPNAPLVEGYPYPSAVVPLGTAEEVFDEKRQKEMAIPGIMLDSGRTVIVYALTARSPSYLYNLQGQRIYELTGEKGPIAVDRWGCWYLVEDNVIGIKSIYRLYKCNQEGEIVVSFDLPIGPVQVYETGTVYCLVFNHQVGTEYRIIRWQRQ